MSPFYKYVMAVKVSMTSCEFQRACPTTIQMKVKGIKRIPSHLSLMGQLTFFVMSFPSSLLTTYSTSVSPSILKVFGPGFKL